VPVQRLDVRRAHIVSGLDREGVDQRHETRFRLGPVPASAVIDEGAERKRACHHRVECGKRSFLVPPACSSGSGTREDSDGAGE
jgi:hypothetical protein